MMDDGRPRGANQSAAAGDGRGGADGARARGE